MTEMSAQSMSANGDEPTDMNQSQSSHASQLQKLQESYVALESQLHEQKNWMQEQLQCHSNDMERMIRDECRRWMQEERKSLVDGQQAELNQLKISLESDETRRLDAVRADFENRLDAVSQQLETVHDFSQQLNERRGRLNLMYRRYVLVVSLLIVLMATMITVYLKSSSTVESQEPLIEKEESVGFRTEIALQHFLDGYDELQREFPNQTDRLWLIMESATIPIIKEDDPTHPAVILLVASKGNSAVAECLAGRYAELVTKSLRAAQHATVNSEMYADSDPDDAKGQLNTVLSRAFDSGSKSGVVLRLEKLPGPAAMIFYRFADNDNAPYKDVAIVLTLTLESTDTGSGKDNVAYDELRKVWGSSLDVDQVDPLLSRIGNSVAFVQPETRDVLAGLNC